MPSLLKNESAAAMSREPDAAVSAERNDYYFYSRPDVQALIAARGKRILDVGCAAGELGAALKRAGASQVVGIEAAAQAAAQARDKLDRVIIGDAQSTDLPLEQASFDYVIFADILEHLVDPWSALASLTRYLQDDGRVVASIPNARFYAVIARLIFNRWGYRESGILDRTHLRFFTWPTIKAMFEGAGLHIESVRPVYRLFEDQSHVGRVGALTSRWFCRLLAPIILWRHFFTFQYLIVARKSDD
jgi:2-polyprenyl-3-methyl-5-hydroxy-6-metoxy-1,4-benzoquinol methylase